MSKVPPYRYDYESFWIVLEQGGPGGWRLHSFPEAGEAGQFQAIDPNYRFGPFPLARSPLEQAAPFLYAALVTAKTAFSNEGSLDNHRDFALSFASAATSLAELDTNLADIYYASRKTVLYDNKTRTDDPRWGPEAAVREFLVTKVKL